MLTLSQLCHVLESSELYTIETNIIFCEFFLLLLFVVHSILYRKAEIGSIISLECGQAGRIYKPGLYLCAPQLYICLVEL